MKQDMFNLGDFNAKSSQDPITEAASTTESEAMTLTTEQYKSIIGQLQKSFNEGVAIMDKLSKATVVEQDPAAAQAEYTEECLAEAYLQSIEDGPIFEAVEREDKESIKEITRSIRAKVNKICKDNDMKFYKTSLIFRSGYKDGEVLSGSVANVNASSSSVSLKSAKTKDINWWTTRLFQLVGMVLGDPNDVDDLVNELNEQLADKLGEYKIVSAIANPSLFDVFRAKFNWKNMDQQKPHMLLVDRPNNIKKKKAIKESTDITDTTDIEEVDILDTNLEETAEFVNDKSGSANKEQLNDETWNKQKDAFKKSFKEAVNQALDELE